MIRLYALLAVIVVCASSCEKTISFTPDNAEPTVVVEATIEDGQPPVVILSRSLNYFTDITPELLVARSFTMRTLKYPMAVSPIA